MPGGTRVECDKHHLVYDPKTQLGCVLCRAESIPPRRRKPLPSWVLPAVGGVLAIGAVVAVFVAIAPSSSDTGEVEEPLPAYEGPFSLYGRWAEQGRPGDGLQLRPDGQAILTESSSGEFFYNYTVEEPGPPAVVSLVFTRASDPSRTPRFRSARLRITPSGPDDCTIFLLSGDAAGSGTRLGAFHRRPRMP